MEKFIFYSYLSSTVAYSLLLLFALLGKTRHLTFVIASLFSLLWSASVVYTTLNNHWFLADTLIFETLRNASWLMLLATLIAKQQNCATIKHFTQSHRLYVVATSTLVAFTSIIEAFPKLLAALIDWTSLDPRFFCHELTAIIGLILIEQLYRNTPLNQRWNLKFICLGLGALLTVDLLVYSKSLLYKHLDITLWQSRGFINASIMPLLTIALFRLKAIEFNTTQTSPRKTVFYTTILFGCGIYLILMSGVGYYLKQANAKWGETLQVLFTFLALLVLTISFSSGKIRALAKLYFSKHFFQYSYDYRDEWIKISTALAQLESLEDLKNFILNTLTSLVESSGGGLWLKDDQGQFFLAASDNLHLSTQELEYLKNSKNLSSYLAKKQCIIDFIELAHSPEIYGDIDLSPWNYQDSQVWLIIPLFHLNMLEAFVVLTQARVPRKLDWEDHDLLKTIGMQLANAIALHKASEALANSRQFETYHRLSAYLVHDLKNIAAQLSLIVRNADKHRNNPIFFDDTIDTVDNAVNKMQHIVEQLKQGKPANTSFQQVNLVPLFKEILQQYNTPPLPTLETTLSTCLINANPSKLSNIVTNLLQNAQDAIKQRTDGWIKLVLNQEDGYAVVKIIDNGIGMEQSFITERLFKPFDTTKGNAGMGIGAYEAKEYILKNHGYVNVESQPKEGTTFTFHIPLAKPEQ